jgi:hypothetical protein
VSSSYLLLQQIKYRTVRRSVGLPRASLFITGGKAAGACEADHSPPSTAQVKECVELYLHTPYTSSWLGVQLSTGTNLPFIIIYKLLLI